MEETSPMDVIIAKFSQYLFGILIALGIILFIFGTLLLIYNRKIIKVLYFFSGLKFFAMLTFFIGLFVISLTKKEIEDATPFFALIGSSAAMGLVGAILAACFGKFGIVVLGLQAGYSVWQIFAPLVRNEIANLVVGLVLAIIFAVICGFYKRPMEVLIASFTGASSFSFGLLYIVVAILGFTNSDAATFAPAFGYGGIAALVLMIILFIVSMWYHYSALIEARKETQQPLMAEV